MPFVRQFNGINWNSFHMLVVVINYPQEGGWGGEGGYLTKFNTERLRPEVQPLTLLYTILADKVPLLYTFYRVCTGPGKPGKSWNFIMAFSRTGKSWKKATGPGKFWKSVKLS